MKRTLRSEKLLESIIVVLLVILLSLISFAGIYVKRNGSYKNIIANYNYAMELEGNRTVILKPDDSKETVTKDSDGNIVEDASENENQDGYTTEEVPVNAESILTEDNYIKSKKILEKRLNEYKFEEYEVKQDVDSGNIILELAENDNVDTVISAITKQGKFEIKDSKTEEVLMDNSMIKEAKVMYNTTTSGTSVYLDIVFTGEGKEKLEQISTDYKTIENKEESSNEESSNEESSDSETEESETEEEQQKEISMEIDGDAIITTSFDEPIVNGQIQLTVGKASTDADTIQGYVKQAKTTATVLTTGEMPVKYTTDTNKYIKTNPDQNIIKCIFIGIIVAIVAISVYFVIKYKFKGLIGSILSIGYIAISLLVIRYTNVKISIAGISAIIAITIINYILQMEIIKNSSKNENNKKKLINVFGKFIFAIIPVFIISIVFTFASSVLLNSFGMILFWGTILTLIYNMIFGKIFDTKA